MTSDERLCATYRWVRHFCTPRNSASQSTLYQGLREWIHFALERSTSKETSSQWILNLWSITYPYRVSASASTSASQTLDLALFQSISHFDMLNYKIPTRSGFFDLPVSAWLAFLPVWPASDPDEILGSMQYRRWEDSKTHGQISHFAMSFLIRYGNGFLSSGEYAMIIRLEDLNLPSCFSVLSRWRCPRLP